MENGHILVALSPEQAIQLYKLVRGLASLIYPEDKDHQLCGYLMGEIKMKLGPQHAAKL